MHNSADAICLFDAGGRILCASASTVNVLGYEPVELIGRNGLDLLHPDDRRRGIRLLRSTVAEPRSPARIRARVRHKDGLWRLIESTASNLLDEPRVAAIIFVYRTIDNGRVQEDGSNHLRSGFPRGDAGLRTFEARTIAHDLKEPLWVIAIVTELLLRRAQLTSTEQECVCSIIDRIRHVASSADDLLSAAARDLHDSRQSRRRCGRRSQAGCGGIRSLSDMTIFGHLTFAGRQSRLGILSTQLPGVTAISILRHGKPARCHFRLTPPFLRYCRSLRFTNARSAP